MIQRDIKRKEERWTNRQINRQTCRLLVLNQRRGRERENERENRERRGDERHRLNKSMIRQTTIHVNDYAGAA